MQFNAPPPTPTLFPLLCQILVAEEGRLWEVVCLPLYVTHSHSLIAQLLSGQKMEPSPLVRLAVLVRPIR